MNRATGICIYPALDAAKLVLALVILCAHYAFTWGRFPRLLDDFFSLYVIAVPFFFACSGFLLFGKMARQDGPGKRETIQRFAWHVAGMYLVWSAIYFAFVLTGWFLHKPGPAAVRAYFHRSLVFTTYPTIWFLPALLVGGVGVHLLARKLSFRAVLGIGVVLYLIGSLGYSYSFLLPAVPGLETLYRWHDQLFFTTRNGLFNGLPFVALGAWLSTRKQRLPLIRSGTAAGLCLAALAGEAYALRLWFGGRGVDMAVSLLPFTFFFMEFLLAVEWEGAAGFRWMREMSTMIFLSQRLFITALPSVLPAAWAAAAFRNSYLGLAGTIALTAGFSWLVILRSGKNRWLGILR